MSSTHIYRVIFLNHGELYEVYARQVTQGGLFGFIEVEELVFGARSEVVVDPSEERLKTEMDGVRRFYVPLHSVVRIDEVERKGVSRITKSEVEEGTLRPFPLVTPPDSTPK